MESTFFSRVVNEHNGIAADAIQGKVCHRECSLAADSCIERVAALCKMWLATSVASAFIDDTAACRPRMTGRMVPGKEASGPWAIALAAKPKQTINKNLTSVLFETAMSASLH